MKVVSYMLTQTDIAAGSAVFTFEYSDGLSLLPSANGVCNLKVSVSLQESVSIAAPPSATVNPATNSACPGSSPSFTVAAVGSGPFAYSWSGPNGFVSTNATITITNAEAVNAGVYTATVTDPFGCSTTCSGTLIYCSPQFTNLTILGSDLILSGSGGTPSATYTVLAANNLTASPSNWVAIGTSNFDSGGQFNFTNPIDFKERFFRLRIP